MGTCTVARTGGPSLAAAVFDGAGERSLSTAAVAFWIVAIHWLISSCDCACSTAVTAVTTVTAVTAVTAVTTVTAVTAVTGVHPVAHLVLRLCLQHHRLAWRDYLKREEDR